MQLKKILTGTLLSGLITLPAYADNHTINMEMKEKTWINTSRAKVVISINATLKNKKMSQLRQEIQSNLNQVYGQDNWHLIRFDRKQNQSGLEQIVAGARGRMEQQQLTNIRQKLNKLNEPGLKYQIAQISYAPSLSDREKALKQLRERIYNRVNDEIQQLEQIYPEKEFAIDSIDFKPHSSDSRTNAKMTEMMVRKQPNQDSSPQQALKVGKQQYLTAEVAIKRLSTDQEKTDDQQQ